MSGNLYDGYTTAEANTTELSPEHCGWDLVFSPHPDSKSDKADVLRMKVPGGWLYRMRSSDIMTFVPEH